VLRVQLFLPNPHPASNISTPFKPLISYWSIILLRAASSLGFYDKYRSPPKLVPRDWSRCVEWLASSCGVRWRTSHADDIIENIHFKSVVFEVTNAEHGAASNLDNIAIGGINTLSYPSATGETVMHAVDLSSEKTLKKSILHQARRALVLQGFNRA
jgi:hypothetical protein